MKTTLHSFTDLAKVLAKVYNPANLPEVRIPRKIEIKLEEIPVEEEEAPAKKLRSYVPFYCTKCGQPTEKVIRSYRISGKDLVPDGHALCPKCLNHSKMISLNTIAKKRLALLTKLAQS